jgi:hypothetical protein
VLAARRCCRAGPRTRTLRGVGRRPGCLAARRGAGSHGCGANRGHGRGSHFRLPDPGEATASVVRPRSSCTPCPVDVLRAVHARMHLVRRRRRTGVGRAGACAAAPGVAARDDREGVSGGGMMRAGVGRAPRAAATDLQVSTAAHQPRWSGSQRDVRLDRHGVSARWTGSCRGDSARVLSLVVVVGVVDRMWGRGMDVPTISV